MANMIGIQKAILLKELKRYCDYKVKNRQDIHGDLPWVFMSAQAFSELYPYMSQSSISRWLRDMESGGLIASTNKLNKKKYDKTFWYTVNNSAYQDLVHGIDPDPDQLSKWSDYVLEVPFLLISQNEKSISQNGKCISQNGKWISQNERPIPPLSSPLSSPNDIYKEKTSFELKQRIINLTGDSIENRMKCWLVYLDFFKTKDFQTQWEFLTTGLEKIDHVDVLHSWVSGGPWSDVKEMRINKTKTWIKNAIRDTKRTAKGNKTFSKTPRINPEPMDISGRNKIALLDQYIKGLENQ